MSPSARRFAPLVAIAAACFAFAAIADARDGDASVDAARAFLEGLDEQQAGWSDLEFDDATRKQWAGRPRGTWLARMNEEQQKAADRLMRSALSPQGYRKVRGCMRVESAARRPRNPKAYALAIWGPPRTNGPWFWRMQGHHVTVNVTEVPGVGTSILPLFLGAEPATVPEGHDDAGYRPLAAEDDRALKLVQSLSPEQRKKTVFTSPPPPTNVMFGNPNQTDPGKPIGISYAELGPEQREMLLHIIDSFTETFRPDIARRYRERIEEAGYDEIHFAWVGGTKRGDFFYWRVQGPRLVMEFDHYDHDPNHIHMLWRDPADELGAELLAEHRRRFHPEQAEPAPAEPKPEPKEPEPKPKKKKLVLY